MSSQLIAQRLAGRGDVCRLECWKLQRVYARWDGSERRTQGFPRGQYAQLSAVGNDRVPPYIANTRVLHAIER